MRESTRISPWQVIFIYQPNRLQACKDDGSLEDQVIEFSWETITTFELEEEGMSFMFQYRRAGKPDRWVRIYSHFYVFLF